MKAHSLESIECPRTGKPCPYLIYCEKKVQGILESKEQSQEQYIETTISNAVHAAESFPEDAEGDWRIAAYKARAEDLSDMLEMQWNALFSLQQDQVEGYRRAAQRARATCLGGPIALKRYLLFGERAERCVALFGIFDMSGLSE